MANNTTITPNVTTTEFDRYAWFDARLSGYDCATKGLILPIVNEYTWSNEFRAFIYLVGLLWSFLAVAIIADIFMCSIERITSVTTTVRVADPEAEGGYKELEVKVWNNTVANLSLLALGTSAPEILLSVIEIVGNGFHAGELGPGTIVGSAAFNLLVISGICVTAIPSPDIRRVASFKVFCVTAFTCVGAYVWLAIVLLVVSPGIVEIWEGCLTLAFFPILILVAYFADRDFCMGKKKPIEEGMVGISLDPSDKLLKSETTSGVRSYQTMGADEEDQQPPHSKRKPKLDELTRELGHDVQHGGLDEREAAKLAAAKLSEDQPHSRGWYRINATRMLTGGRKLVPKVLDGFQDLYENIQVREPGEVEDETDPDKDYSVEGTKAVVKFSAPSVAVYENEGRVRIGIKRSGRKNIPCTVRIETLDGTAIAGEDYIPFKEDVTFEKDEELKPIYIQIVDDNEWEPDESFFVRMSIPEREDKSHEHVTCGKVNMCTVTIINDDEPGKLEFAKPSLLVKESFSVARVPVKRVNGCDGHVSVTWKTTSMTAKEGVDFKGKEGLLKFDNQETEKIIEIPLIPSNKKERDDCFAVELLECDGGATKGKIGKTIVTIINDDEYNGIVSRLMNMTKSNLEGLALESHSWLAQFTEGMNVNGGDIEGASFLDYVLHFLTFGFKVIFAFIPPAKYLHGWPTFIISLSVIGLLTALIGDLASIFGCLVGIPDAITAITLVALGTSMPDTFASKTAAIGEKTADSSVGNVNGSNSVNVFLGLGLPWVIASIYWAVQTSEPSITQFEVKPGTVAFSVIVYSVVAVLALLMLVLRRNLAVFGKAELGGPAGPKIFSGVFLVTLWVIYVVLSSLKATKII